MLKLSFQSDVEEGGGLVARSHDNSSNSSGRERQQPEKNVTSPRSLFHRLGADRK